MPIKKEKWASILENIALVSQIGITMFVTIVGSLMVGNLIDKKMNTSPVFMFLFMILGIASSFVTLYKMTTRSNKRSKRK